MIDLQEIRSKNPSELQLLLEEQQRNPGELLGKLAEDMGLITDEQLAQALAEQMGMQVVNFGDVTIAKEVLEQVSEPMAQLYRIVPIHFDEENETLTVAMCDPQNLSVQDELRTFLGFNIRIVVATENDVLSALEKYYAAAGDSVEKIIGEMIRKHNFILFKPQIFDDLIIYLIIPV